MTTSAPLFTQDNLASALQSLCGTIGTHSGIAEPGALLGESESIETTDDLRQRLTSWIGGGDGISGWLLTTEALHIYPGTSGLPDEIPLHAELHRKSDDTSLNLRQTSTGWNWEELKHSPESAEGSRLVEKSSVMTDPDHVPAALGKFAEYEVEWALTDAPGKASPATFRPARSRFVGWTQNLITESQNT